MIKDSRPAESTGPIWDGGAVLLWLRSRRTLGGLALAAFLGAMVACGGVHAADPLDMRITYVTQEEDRLVPLSLLDTLVPDEGVMGARQALEENQTTGRFLGHNYELNEVIVPKDGDLAAAFKEALAAGDRLFILDLHADQVESLADLPEAADAVLFNTRAPDDRLRREDCRANVFHIIPSRAMYADALAQYLVWKQWREWFLIHGSLEPDLAFAAAIERAAAKFGGKIVETREYEYSSTARRTDSGHIQIQTQIPVFTQDAEDHDVVVVADESDIFGEYLPYRTWEPRPVVGTQGLIASAWHRSQEQWGDSGPASLREVLRALDVRAGLYRLAHRPHHRRGSHPDLQHRPRSSARLPARRSVRDRRVQGRGADLPEVEPAAPPADPDRRPADAGLGVAAARVSPPAHAARHHGL